MSLAAADRNLLFGILALQMDFIGRDALIAAMNAWVLQKDKPLGQILREQGALAQADYRLLEELVRRHLDKNGQDAQRSLAALPAPAKICQELRRIADRDLDASLNQLAATPSAPPEPGPTSAPISSDGAPRFHILRPHASGGLGDVFVAEDKELHREVALKEIQLEHADHPENRARFVREAEITGGLEHPGIVPVYALGHYGDGRPYYAMRFIRGDSLKEAIGRFHESSGGDKEHNLELRQLLNRFIAVCNAIAYAHSRGVLHRDLKPSNIMLGEFGETLVVDWGLAKSFDISEPADEDPESTKPWLQPKSSSGTELTHAGQALGTPAYMSPEQASGRLDQLSPASDVYSLGATLYHLLTGRAPFGNSDAGKVLPRVQKGSFPRPRRVNGEVPAALEAICLRAMALSPMDRYASAKALADDLEHWLADEAVTAHVEAWPARLGRWMRHHKWLVGSVATIGLLVPTLAVAAWMVNEAAQQQRLRGIADDQRDKAEAERYRADRSLYFSRINLADRAWQEGQIAHMDEVLALTEPQYTGGEDLHSFERSYLLRLRKSSLYTFQLGGGPITSLAFSPDGQRIAAACLDGTIRVMDLGNRMLVFKGHTRPAFSVAFSPDGKRLVSAGRDGCVKIWDANTGLVGLTLNGKNSTLFPSAAFSPDGRRVAAGSFGGTVWDAVTGQEGPALKGKTNGLTCVAFSPDGDRVAFGSAYRTVTIWDTRTGQQLLTIRGHTENVTGIAFSPDGQRLASASADKTVRVWDAHAGQEILSLNGHSAIVWNIAYSPDGQRLASASYDKTVKVWDARTGAELLTLKGHTQNVRSVAFHPEGQRLASASYDGSIKIWDARMEREGLLLRGHSLAVNSVAFSLDSQRLVSTGGDKTVKVWDPRTGLELLTLKGHTGVVASAAFSSDGQRLASAGSDKSVRIWDARSGRELFAISGHTGIVNCVSFSPDGQHVASASHDRTALISSTATGQVEFTLKGHRGPVRCVVFSPDGQQVASASLDGTVKLWDARTGRATSNLPGHNLGALAVAYSPDGRQLASATGDGTLKVWDVRTEDLVLSFKVQTGPLSSMVYSPDGQRLVSTSQEGKVTLWDAQTGQEGLTFNAHAIVVNSVAMSPDGLLLACAGSNGTVKVWDASSLGLDANLQRQALGYFRFVAETVGLKDEMMQRIRQSPTLTEPVRKLALELCADYREAPGQLNNASWSVVSAPWAQAGAYAMALRQAVAACRLEPSNSAFLNTLGAAQYRNGQYARALNTLLESQKLNPKGDDPRPADLAFQAMAQFQLGRKTEAASRLELLREIIRKSAFDREAEDLLKETERLVEKEK